MRKNKVIHFYNLKLKWIIDSVANSIAFLIARNLTACCFSAARTEDPETPLLEPDFSDLKVHQRRVESKVCVGGEWKNSWKWLIYTHMFIVYYHVYIFCYLHIQYTHDVCFPINLWYSRICFCNISLCNSAVNGPLPYSWELMRHGEMTCSWRKSMIWTWQP